MTLIKTVKLMTILCSVGVALLSAACGSEKNTQPVAPRVKVKPSGASDDATSDNSSTMNGITSNSSNDPMAGVSGKLIDAKYDLSIKAGFLTVCKGTVNIRVNIDAGNTGGGMPFQMPDSCLSCMGAKIDISKLLQGLGTATGPATGVSMNPAALIHVQDGVVGFKDLGGVKFSPGRPMIPSFLALKPEELARLDTTWNASLTNTQTGEQGSGSLHARVTSAGQAYTPPNMGKTFNNTLRFETTFSGFDSVKMKTYNMLLDKMGMVISLDPIAFPQIFAELNLGRLRAEMNQSGQQMDIAKLESQQCGINSGFTKFMMGIMNDPNKLQAMQGLLGGGNTTGGTGGVLGGTLSKILIDSIINNTKVVIKGDLAHMDGI